MKSCDEVGYHAFGSWRPVRCRKVDLNGKHDHDVLEKCDFGPNESIKCVICEETFKTDDIEHVGGTTIFRILTTVK